jgi:glycerol-3-phosphate acyltransferase PlsX
MTIALDAMGSDKYPDPEILGAINAARIWNEEIILVGNQELIEQKLRTFDISGLPIKIEHAPDMIEMSDKAVQSGRQKPNNSMAVGMQLVRDQKAQAVVTAGNTGAAMFNALRKLGRIKGVLRPALSGLVPVRNGYCVVIDLGANVDCKPDYLVQFAIMGVQYVKKILKKENPRVGLISNGEEPGKGNQLIKETFPLLEKSGLNFIGNIESKELFNGDADVAVTDGFVGNVFLKTSEAIARLINDTLKQELTSSLRNKLGAFLAMPAFNHLRTMIDPSETGAAPLLGIDGLVFVGHGRSNAYAIQNGIRVAREAVQTDLLSSISSAIREQISSIGSSF